EALEHVVEALRRVLEGGHYLTPALNQRLVIRSVPGSPDATTVSAVNKLSEREKEVMSMLGKGMSTREIANIFGLSVKTIETHRLHIKEKLGMHDSVELVRFAIEAQQKQDQAKADAAAAQPS
ncbi:MAG: response regulator transcription factor, partial [Roseimicrobium sp.]